MKITKEPLIKGTEKVIPRVDYTTQGGVTLKAGKEYKVTNWSYLAGVHFEVRYARRGCAWVRFDPGEVDEFHETFQTL